MANLSTLLGGGGIKKISYYTETASSGVTGFTNSIAITAVDDVNKTDVIVNGFFSTGNATNEYLFATLNSATEILYSKDLATDVPISVKVVEYF